MALLIAFMSLLATAAASVSDCSSGSSLFKLTSMSFSPDPTVIGQNSTLLLSMTVPEEINGGTATYATTYNFIPFSPTVDPLCNTIVCPVRTGTLDTKSSYPIPDTLTGSLGIKITWTDDTGRELLCVNIRTTIGNAAKQLVLRKNKSHNAMRTHTAKARNSTRFS